MGSQRKYRYRRLYYLTGLVWLLFQSSWVSAQYFDTGQDPAFTRWYRIETPHFQVIFPEDFTNQGLRFANILEKAWTPVGNTMPGSLKSLPVIVHNQSVTSNALVSWAPRRMEIYPCSPQGNYPQDWLEQLALHELRHARQLSYLKKGLSRVLGVILGEQYFAALTGLYVPSWFLEGDAVVTETALSLTGRGRMPDFEMPLKAQLCETGPFSYDKQVFGSYRQFVPDHYILGYHLVAEGRRKYGPKIWEDAMESTARIPFTLFPFSIGMKKNSGTGKDRFYKETMNSLAEAWKNERNTIQPGSYRIIRSCSDKNYVSYGLPTYINDSVYFALKHENGDVRRFVKISGGQETILFTPGNLLEDAISFTSDCIIWAEEKADLRWENRSFTEIWRYDICERKARILARKSRYFAPSLSPDGMKICVSEVKADYTGALVILDAKDGHVLQKINAPEASYYLTPTWDNTGEHITACLQGKGGKSMVMITPGSGKTKTIMATTHVEVSGPVMYNEKVYFIGSHQGISNVYETDTTGKKVFRVTSSILGAHDPCISNDGRKLLYCEYSAHGYFVAETDLPSADKLIQADMSNDPEILADAMTQQEGRQVDFGDTSQFIQYEIRRYHPILHLFNLHSWAPLYIDATSQTANPGVSVMSQNLMNTLVLSAGYEYLPNEETGLYKVNASYRKFWPWIDLSAETGQRSAEYFSGLQTPAKRVTWNETSIKSGITIPINLTSGRYIQSLVSSLKTSFYQVDPDASTPKEFFRGHYQSLDVQVFAYRFQDYSFKDLYPRIGQMVDFNFRNTPFDGTQLGRIFSIETGLYLPGLLKHHSFRMYAGYQEVHSGTKYRFADLMVLPDGFTSNTGNYYRTFRSYYSFPLVYPDFSLPHIIYLKRLKGELFFHAGSGDNRVHPVDYQSTGFEVSADFHLFRFYAPLELGIRNIYDIGHQSWTYEIVYQISLNQFSGGNRNRNTGWLKK